MKCTTKIKRMYTEHGTPVGDIYHEDCNGEMIEVGIVIREVMLYQCEICKSCKLV